MAIEGQSVSSKYDGFLIDASTTPLPTRQPHGICEFAYGEQSLMWDFPESVSYMNKVNEMEFTIEKVG